MRSVILFILALIAQTYLFPSRVYGQNNLKGTSWILTKIDTLHLSKVNSSSPNEVQYLKFEFYENGTMLVASHYDLNASNAVVIPYSFENSSLRFGFDNLYEVISTDFNYLILDKIQDQQPSVRHSFTQTQAYLDQLPLPKEDIIPFKEDTIYEESIKLYATFETISPDFHAHFNKKVRKTYPKGDNYFKATFVIQADGSIEDIKILNSINEKFDKKAIKVISSTKRKWTLPLLNGQRVGILKTIEDHYTKR